MRDNDTNSSKGFAFINFASFDAADAALEAMNGQHLCNRPITISYAFKKDAKGERHGTDAERFPLCHRLNVRINCSLIHHPLIQMLFRISKCNRLLRL